MNFGAPLYDVFFCIVLRLSSFGNGYFLLLSFQHCFETENILGHRIQAQDQSEEGVVRRIRLVPVRYNNCTYNCTPFKSIVCTMA